MFIDFDNQDLLAIGYLESLGSKSTRTRALRLLLSKLEAPSLSNRTVLRKLFSSLRSSIKTVENKVFWLSNNDFLLVGSSLETPNAERVISSFFSELRLSFPHDPFALSAARSHDGSVRRYDLRDNLRSLISECMNRSAHVSELAIDEASKIQSELLEERLRLSAKEKLTPAILSKIEQALRQTSISQLSKSQPICYLTPDGEPEIMFTERYVSIVELAQSVSNNLDIAGSRWLFTHLTQLLDQRLLEHMRSSSRDGAFKGALSINLNVISVTSEQFQLFDASISDDVRQTIMIEFNIIDVLSDLDLYTRIRNLLQKRGYLVALDGVTHDLLKFINRRDLGADFVKLIASGKFRELSRDALKSIVRTIDNDEPQRYIITRCDDVETAEFARQLQVALFQGFYFDALIRFDQNKDKEEEESKRVSPSVKPKINVYRR